MISYHKLKEITFEPEFINVLYLFSVSVNSFDAQFVVKLLKHILHISNIFYIRIGEEWEKSVNFQ